MGYEVSIPYPPQRIISVVPSQTEFLFDLGLRNEIVGITKFCVHPPELFREKARVGGTKKINLNTIKSLNPDLIIGNKEENERDQILALKDNYPVWMSDIKTLEDTFQMMLDIGKITGREEKAAEIIEEIKNGFDQLKEFITANSLLPKKCLYLIWKDPYMCAGKDTFIDYILATCGLENLMTLISGRYPEVTSEQLKVADPDLIFLSSEPYPFREKHISEFKAFCPNAKVIVVDGEMFSWYGSRLRYAPAYLEGVLAGL